MTKTILMVAYYYPPWGGGPVLRALKFTKYLARMGWRVQVLTVRPEYYEPFSNDESLLGEVKPPTQVTRTGSFRPIGRLGQALLTQVVNPSSRPTPLMRRVMPIARATHSLLVPDDKVLWIPHALWAGVRAISNSPPDIVFVTAPPHSATLLGVALSRMARRPLVVDFRDDWIGNPLYRPAARLRAQIESTMEAAVVRQSTAVIVPTLPSKERLGARYPDSARRLHVIPNGFDEDDIVLARQLDSSAPADPRSLHCIYAGLINQRRDLSGLLHAIQRVDADTPGRVRLCLAGFIPDSVFRLVSELGLSGCVESLGYRPHVDVLRRVMDSDVAVLVSSAAEGSATAIPSKLFEYVACGTYVLGLVDPGATEDMIRSHSWGTTCSPASGPEIERILRDLMRRKQARLLSLGATSVAEVAEFSRRRQTQALDRVLRSAAQERR